MDSNVDLLQYLTGEEVAPLEPTNPASVKFNAVEEKSVKNSISEADSAIAVGILQSVVEDTTKMLDSGSDPAVNESSSQDSVGVIDWFDVLDEEVSHALAGYVVTEETGPILSPVSAEDVESILSSGSPSPSHEDMDSSVTDWVSILPVDSMEVGSPAESVQSSVFDEVQVSQTDLDCLLAQVKHVPDDHNYPSMMPPSPIEGPSSSVGSSRPKPYSRKGAPKTPKAPKETKPANRQERKKQQNKDAALRYRLKKKQEADIISTEVGGLEARNTELKDKVEQMTREIKYLKNLLSDVYKAKGYLKSQWIVCISHFAFMLFIVVDPFNHFSLLTHEHVLM